MRDREGRPLAGAIEHGLHPWVAFAVLPMFAFANAGVSLKGITPATLLEPITLGIAAGLIAGKAIGVYGAAGLMIWGGWSSPPARATTRQFFGVCVLCGIGFTMSLFIGGLAFEGLDPAYETRVKLGVLTGSILAGMLGTLVLWRRRSRTA
jgi:NhaA family Na+:H+ antiporter